MGAVAKGKSSHCEGWSWAGVRGRTFISLSSHPSCRCFPVTGLRWEPMWSSSSRSDSGVPKQCREKQRMELRGRWRIAQHFIGDCLIISLCDAKMVIILFCHSFCIHQLDFFFKEFPFIYYLVTLNIQLVWKGRINAGFFHCINWYPE